MIQSEICEMIIAPYGSWKSPITPDLILAGTVRLGQICLDGPDVYWAEGRPNEGGRNVIVRRTPDGRTTDMTPAPLNARTRVHEYGGGEFIVDRGTIFFSNFADQRLYRQVDASAGRAAADHARDRAALRRRGRRSRPRPADLRARRPHGRGREAVNTIAGVRMDGDAAGGQVLVSGNNFYANPRLSPDGTRLAWLTWNHPNMPWDGCELWVADVLADGTLDRAAVGRRRPRRVDLPAGVVAGRRAPLRLRPHRLVESLPLAGRAAIEQLTDLPAEFGLPQWVFGMSTYAFASAERIICAYTQDGVWHLASLDTRSKALTPFDLPYTEISNVRVGADGAVFTAASPSQSAAIVRLDLGTGQVTVLRRSSDVAVDAGYLSTPQSIEFPTEGGLTAHGIYYPPTNRDFAAPRANCRRSERPPLLVLSHGGPTGATSTSLSLGMQYWTSRGFAVLDVNYGGSTGYGRAYRQRLDDAWGIVDVDDCVNGARYLVAQGLADEKRLAIRGGSAGGYTTLAALTFRDVFRAGASHFGVSDLEALATDTHKFESRYLDRLVGPYPARRDLYIARSPIHFTDRLSTPMILLQGLEDKVVPPSQAEKMFAAVKAKGLPVAYVPFEGEQHGFRKAENIKRAMEAELYFYSRIFGFDLADPVEPVQIENL